MTAPANTGKDRSSKVAVIKIDQIKSEIFSIVIPHTRMLITVQIKFIAPSREETPARCSEKIAKSTDIPACAICLLRGGYTVHPVPAPPSIKLLINKLIRAGGRNQNLILFNRGNAISGAPSIKGRSQFPNEPIRIGITIKKIIIKACAVTITLYKWSSPTKEPALPNSSRIIILRDLPTIPAQPPASKYSVPISLCLADHNHLALDRFIFYGLSIIVKNFNLNLSYWELGILFIFNAFLIDKIRVMAAYTKEIKYHEHHYNNILTYVILLLILISL